MTSLETGSAPPRAAAITRAHCASFRDPAGFVFTTGGVLYRQINPAGRADYDQLVTSGLYQRLADAGVLVRHEQGDPSLSPDGGASLVIRPERVEFISYPYEWSFSQLKDAALLTVQLQKAALEHGMSLKDATPFNVAFVDGRPICIDTLSFERLTSGKPWVAYRQFVQSFLSPLALMSLVDVRLLQLLRVHLDGVPLDLASRLLPARTRVFPGLLTHVHLQAAAERRLTARADTGPRPSTGMSERAAAALLDSLERTVARLEWRPGATTWGNYYKATNYTEAAFAHKREIVDAAIARLVPARVWDVGANDGTFSRLASGRGIPTVAFDADPVAVEKNYRRIRESGERCLVPVLLDLTNPSAASGWANEERDAFADRGPVDLVLALALIHHLTIGHNVPFLRVAELFARIGRALVIEFVPKHDSQVQRMLAARDDVFTAYTQSDFEAAFSQYFVIEQAIPVRETARVLYVMRRRES